MLLFKNSMYFSKSKFLTFFLFFLTGVASNNNNTLIGQTSFFNSSHLPNTPTSSILGSNSSANSHSDLLEVRTIKSKCFLRFENYLSLSKVVFPKPCLPCLLSSIFVGTPRCKTWRSLIECDNLEFQHCLSEESLA